MNWFKVDGREYRVRVFEPEESFSVLYSENTGRTLSVGAAMVLDPLGTFFNYTLTVGAIRGEERSFEDLWEYLSTPRDKSILLVFPKSSPKANTSNRNCFWKTKNEQGNEVLGFEAYVSTGKRKIKKIVENNDGELSDVLYDTFTINFVAMKAQVLP